MKPYRFAKNICGRLPQALLLLGALLLIPLSPACAADRNTHIDLAPQPMYPSVLAQPRVALVIGNTHYGGTHELKNPENDARAIAASLQKLGFTVTLVLDADRANMLQEVHTFCNQIKSDGSQTVALIYYSGHGMQVNERNFLLPIDFALPTNADDMDDAALSVQRVLGEVAKAQASIRIAVLDACRDNPFEASRSVAGRGLSRTALSGLYIAYATAADKTADDNDTGKNGLYTTALLRYLSKPGISLDQVFTKTRDDVYEQSKHTQWPFVHDGLPHSDSFYLAGPPIADDHSHGHSTVIKELPTTATIVVNCATPRARILLDGVPITPGKPFVVTVEVGTKTVRVEAAANNFNPVTKEITVEPGQSYPLNLDMIPTPPPPPVIQNNPPGRVSTYGHPNIRNPKDGAEMVFITKSGFEDYYMYKTPVTVAQYQRFCNETGRPMPPEPSWGWSGHDNHPIVNVTWFDAVAYSRWAGVALPFEGLWEAVAHGNQGPAYPWGDEFDSTKLWCSHDTEGDANGTHAVGGFPASPYGVQDMAGNVWQWCSGWTENYAWPADRIRQVGAAYTLDGPDYHSRPDPDHIVSEKDETTYHILHGGSWYDKDVNLFRTDFRLGYPPDAYSDKIGFRCMVHAITANGKTWPDIRLPK